MGERSWGSTDKSPPTDEVLPWYEATKDRPETKPLKVAHIITRLDRGGSTDNTLLTVLGLDPARYRVTLVTGMTTFPSPLVRRLKERPDITVRFPWLTCRPFGPFIGCSGANGSI